MKPKTAFRVVHLFQINEVELSRFGIVTTQLGGAGVLILGIAIVMTTLHYLLWIAFTISSLHPLSSPIQPSSS